MADEAAGQAGEQWQLDGDAAELYQRHLVPAVTAGWAADLVERAGLRRGERVLDVACGTGVAARAAAGRVGRAGHVAGVDINAAMLAVARSLPAGPGASVGWLEASAVGLPFRAGELRRRAVPAGVAVHPGPAGRAGRDAPRPDRGRQARAERVRPGRAQPGGSTGQLSQALTADVAAALRACQADGGLVFPQEAHVLLATA